MLTYDWRSAVVLFNGTEHVYNLPALTLLESIPYHSIGMVVIDPPSLIGVGVSGNDEVMPIDEQVAAFVPIADQVSRILRPGGAAAMLGEPTTVAAWESAAAWAGLRLMGDMAVLWDETVEGPEQVYQRTLSVRQRHALLRPSDLPSLFTAVRWHVKPGFRYTFNPASSISCDSNVIVCRQVPVLDRYYVTQRPVELFNYLVSLLTAREDMVVDPFCGSGSALVAAKMCGRGWIGGDRDPAQCAVARRRVARAEIEEAYLQPLRLWVRGEMVTVEG